METGFPLAQSLDKAHRLGSHHVVTSQNGEVAASAGFGGEVIVWSIKEGQWAEQGKIIGTNLEFSNLFKSYMRLVQMETRRARFGQ